MSEEKSKVITDILKLIEKTRSEKLAADYIHPSGIPDIDLYMDQITTFMDEHLATTKRYEDDKILTKTMINNYAKNNLLPPPEKKKYSKDHLLILTFIYYYKNILSINDIQTLLAPLKEMYFKKDRTPDLGTIYERIFNMEISQSEPILDDIQTKLNAAKDIFPDTEGDEKELLTFFSFICLLSYDIYIKKQPMLYFAIYLAIIFVECGLIAGLALVIGYFAKYKVVCVLIPFGVILFIHYFKHIINTQYELSPLYFLHPTPVVRYNNGWIILGFGVLMAVITAAVLLIKGRDTYEIY